MSTDHHDPIANGAPANSSVINAPLAQLDQAIKDIDFTPSGNSDEFLNGNKEFAVPAGTGSTNGHVIQEEGVDLVQKGKLDFQGASVKAQTGANATEIVVNGAVLAKLTATLTGDITLTNDNGPVLFLDPGGADRVVKLPPFSTNNPFYVIANIADAVEKITVKNNAGTETIVEINQGELRIVFSDGTSALANTAGSGSSLTVEEEDGAPSVSNVDTIIFSNGAVTDNEDGSVTVDIGGGGGDMLSTLVNAEVELSGASTLTSTAFGKMHILKDAATPANYTTGLPPCSGNAGKIIGFRVEEGATKLFTLDPNSAEKINKKSTVTLWELETIILLCDGSNWIRLGGTDRPMMCRIENQAGTDQTISNSALTTLQFDTKVFDVGNIGDTSNNGIRPRRTGKYRESAQIRWKSNSYAADRVLMALYIDGAANPTNNDERYCGASTVLSNFVNTEIEVAAGELVDFKVFQNSGYNKDVYASTGTEYPNFVLEEVIEW